MSAIHLNIPNLPSTISIEVLALRNDLSFFLENVPDVLKNPVLEKTNSKQRQLESLACRYLLTKQLQNLQQEICPILYTESGKPYVNENIHFSLSHTSTHACSAVHLESPLGIDIELNHRPIDKISSRFLNQTELKLFDTPEKRILAWSMKEAIYKANEQKGISFRDQIKLHLKEQKYYGKILSTSNENREFSLYFVQNKEFSLSIAVANHPVL